MNRDRAIAALTARDRIWDVVIIGGGATGLGTALDAASRGYRTALLEARDFAHGTSSRSTKLVHGGVRYLREGNVALVRRALHERTLLQKNAPHLVTGLGFIVPAYARFDRAFYGAGLKLYDLLARGSALPRSRLLSREETAARLPTLATDGLRGGVLYHDAQFDDARLAIALARAATDAGATVVNYAPVVAVEKSAGRISGVVARDAETGRELTLRARAVINAAGVFGDAVRAFDEPAASPLLAPSQGAHLVLPARFLPGGDALMIPKTSDGRVLFAIPWLGRVIVGTTDTPVQRIEAEPRPLAEEIRFLLDHAERHLAPAPKIGDVLSVYAGLRPLVRSAAARSSAQLSRDHVVVVSAAGLVTITGGKWTTYRKMAEDVVDRAAGVAGLPARPCRTAGIRLTHDEPAPGSSSVLVSTLPLAAGLPVHLEGVRRAVREEMARTIDDVLARRTRALLLDARASIALAPAIGRILAAELGWDERREARAIEEFRASARQYLPPDAVS